MSVVSCGRESVLASTEEYTPQNKLLLQQAKEGYEVTFRNRFFC